MGTCHLPWPSYERYCCVNECTDWRSCRVSLRDLVTAGIYRLVYGRVLCRNRLMKLRSSINRVQHSLRSRSVKVCTREFVVRFFPGWKLSWSRFIDRFANILSKLVHPTKKAYCSDVTWGENNSIPQLINICDFLVIGHVRGARPYFRCGKRRSSLILYAR